MLTGVSVSADSTGTHSLYTTYQDYEIMFHVSTLLPYTPNNRQQVSGAPMTSSCCTAEPQPFPFPRLLAACRPSTGSPDTILCSRWRPLALEPLCPAFALPGVGA